MVFPGWTDQTQCVTTGHSDLMWSFQYRSAIGAVAMGALLGLAFVAWVIVCIVSKLVNCMRHEDE